MKTLTPSTPVTEEPIPSRGESKYSADETAAFEPAPNGEHEQNTSPAEIDPRIESLVLRWEELRDQGQSVAVADLCRECPELVDAVQQRLQVLGSMRQFLEETAPPRGEGEIIGDDHPGRTLSGYEILGELGRGGMGVVYKAIQRKLKRIVALKMILVEAHGDTLTRFQTEAETIARLQHPNIVQIFEIGTFEGKPFFSMEFVDGGTLADQMSDEPPNPRTAAEIMRSLGLAIFEAHAKKVVHRDLKPSNILIAKKEAAAKLWESAAKITDFGLAKQLDDVSEATQSGMLLGTLAYMAPEQADGRVKDTGPATDIHALGCILYEMLTGRRPFESGTVVDTLVKIRTQDPAPPSSINSRVHRDLETICLKCLQKSPDARYANAKALADDLGHFLNGEPIAARPVGRVERFGRWCRRKPAAAAALFVTALLVFVALPGWFWYQWQLSATQEKASLHKQAADAAGKAKSAAEESARTMEYFSLVNGAKDRSTQKPLGWSWAGLDDLKRAAALKTPARNGLALRNEAARCLGGIDVRSRQTFDRLARGHIAFSPDGRLLALAEYPTNKRLTSRRVWILDFSTGKILHEYSFRQTPVVTGIFQLKVAWRPDGANSIAFSPDSNFLYVGTRFGWLHRWDVTTKNAKPQSWNVFTENKSVNWVLPTLDGKSVIVASSQDKVIARWNVDGEVSAPAAVYSAPETMSWVGLIPQLQLVAYVKGSRIHFLESESLQPSQKHADVWLCWPFDCDATGELLVGDWGKRIAYVDLPGRELVRHTADLKTEITHRACDLVRLSRGGSLAVTLDYGDDDRMVRLWETAGSRLAATLVLPGSGFADAAFHPRQDVLAVANDGKIILYDIGGLRMHRRIAHQARNDASFSFLPDGHLVCRFANGDRQTISIWDAESGKRLESNVTQFSTPAYPSADTVAWHPFEKVAAFITNDAALKIWNYERDALAPLPLSSVSSVCFDRTGHRLWTISDRNLVLQAWSWPRREKAGPQWSDIMRVTTGDGSLHCLAVGVKYVAAGSYKGSTFLIRSKDTTLKRELKGGKSVIRSVALNRDETLLAAGSQQGALFLYRIPSGKLVAMLSDHRDSIESIDFRADGRLLATGSRDGTIHLYRVSGNSCQKLISFSSHRAVRQLSFHPNGRQLMFTIDRDIGVRVWELEHLQAKLANMHIDDGEWPTPSKMHPTPPGVQSNRSVVVTGSVWHDVNGDGVRERNEHGIGKAVVELHSTFDDTVGNGDDKLLASVRTDSMGRYSLKKTFNRYRLYYLAIRAPSGFAVSTKEDIVDRFGRTEIFEVGDKDIIKADIALATALPAIADTSLDAAQPKKTFGKSGVVATRQITPIYSLVQFDVSRIKAPIVKATLRLQWHTSERLSQGVGVFGFTRPWKEATATWGNVNDGNDPFGAIRGGVLDPGAVDSPQPITSPANGPVAEWDVTDVVKEWQSGKQANHGFLLRSSGDSGRLDFWSKEGARDGNSFGPQLILSVDATQWPSDSSQSREGK